MSDVENNPANSSSSHPVGEGSVKTDPLVIDSSSPSFAVANQPSYLRTLFLGSGGLRPGWGIAFYFVAFFLLQKFAGDWLASLRLGELRTIVANELIFLLAAFIPSFLLARIERRPWGGYGLPLRRAFGKQFWIGTLWGFAGISLLVGAQYELHGFDYGHLALHGMRIVKFALFWALMFLLVGFFEEFLFRGYSQFTLTRGIGFWPAAAALSCLFGLIHYANGGEAWSGLLAAAAIGFFFCLTLRRTGNLWFAVGFHTAWDWGETFFYSVPDSGTVFPGHLLRSSFHGPPWLTGGSVGPEGSILCFVVIAVLWLTFDRVYREVKYLSGPAKLDVPSGETASRPS